MEEKSLLFQIKSLEQLILRDFFMKEMCKDFDIKKVPSPTQMRIMDYILQSKNQVVFQKDLEQVFNLRRATISEVLITMEKNNMIERIVSSNDTRTKEIRLSKDAQDLFKKNKKKLLEIERKITKNISDTEIQIFSNVIVKMRNNIQDLK